MWLPDDTEAALDWLAREDLLCGGCSQPKTESMDPANSESYEAVPVTCFACAARDAEKRHAQEIRGSGEMGSGAFDGIYLTVSKKGD